MLKQKNNALVFVPLEKKYLRNNSLTGFALIELLVAISIFAVIATVVYTTLYTSLKAHNRTQNELKINQEINQVLDKLSAELRNCYDAEYNEEEDKGGFVASVQDISFFTIQNVYSQGNPQKLLARVNYNFSNGKLFKKIQLDEDAFLDPGNFQQEELLADIQELNFSYLYLSEGEAQYEWKDQWQDKSAIPKAVKMHIKRHDPDSDTSVTLNRYILLMQGEFVSSNL
jgi:type II secretion system protein J